MTAGARDILWTQAEADDATGGHSTLPWQATGVSIDGRTVAAGDLFVAVRGPRFDAHDFVGQAFTNGAACALISRIPRNHPENKPLLIVDDTYSALKKLARAARQRSDARRVAVTGSVGKTSTKEALAAALQPSGKVAATAGNLNNLWGVPLSLARMPRDAAFGVYEIGMNHAGEITPLSRMVRPDVAIITSVEAVHLEFFDSVEDIARAKAEVFDGLRRRGTAILNRDNRFFDLLSAEAVGRSISHIVSFGAHADADVRLLDYKAGAPSRVTADVMGEHLDFTFSLPGRHNAVNAMAVLAAVKVLGADVGAAGAALGAMDAPAGRGKRLQVTLPDSGTALIIDDSYNASPASMRAAFKVLGQESPGTGGRRIAVLGDMLELGPGSARAHAELADDLADTGVDVVLTTGDNMMHLYDALPRSHRGGHAARADDLIPLLTHLLRDGDVVLDKGSNSQKLGIVVRALVQSGADAQHALPGN
ncbi:MAG: UDP-N-acetylmuramoyl-tripeptide--D-alanyl-D-alanine ligase [Alphaproteobacteria bacterium]